MRGFLPTLYLTLLSMFVLLLCCRGGVPSTPAATPIPLPAGSEKAVQLAKEDLARRFGIAVDEIDLVEVEEVNWPDASLGCPEPGKMYAQVITSGYRIILSAMGKAYEYYSDKSGVVLCDLLPSWRES